MVEYPQTLPLDCVQRLFTIVKDKTVQTNIKEFKQCAWNVVGYLLYLSDGKNIFGDDNPAHSGELQDSLENLADAVFNYSMDENYSAQSQEEAGDIMTIITILSVVAQLLQGLKFFKRDRTPEGPRIILDEKAGE